MTTKIAFVGAESDYAYGYGAVYKKAAELAVQGGGCRVRHFWDDQKKVVSASYVEEEAIRLDGFHPHLVFCDSNIFPALPQSQKMEVESWVAATVAPIVERFSFASLFKEDITLKDNFYDFCVKQGIPTPRSFLLKHVDIGKLRHADVRRLVGVDSQAPLVYKKVLSAEGRDIFVVYSDDAFNALKARGDLNQFVAQEAINVGGIPFSMRVVVFGQEILGGAVAINPTHPFCSNAHQGGIAFDLAVPWEKTGRTSFPKHTMIRDPLLYHILEQAGVDPLNRRIPGVIAEQAKTIGAYPAGCLLRGLDVIFDTTGAHYFLECNHHPGPPSGGMWLSMTGKKHHASFGGSKTAAEVGIASEIIARTIVSFGATAL